MTLNDLISRVVPTITAEAHCDIPCGIYDPTLAKIAAKTVARMVDQLLDLEEPTDKASRIAYVNASARRVKVKEEHAEICKRELQILWSDFFKPENIGGFPNIHETFWKALKLAGKNKVEINKDAAKQLLVAVDEIAQNFYKAKNVPDRFKAYQEITDKLY